MLSFILIFEKLKTDYHLRPLHNIYIAIVQKWLKIGRVFWPYTWKQTDGETDEQIDIQVVLYFFWFWTFCPIEKMSWPITGHMI